MRERERERDDTFKGIYAYNDGTTISKCLIFKIMEGEIGLADQKTREGTGLK